MAFIENGKYQSSAAMGSSCQELASGLLLDVTGITILKETYLNVSNDTTIKINGIVKTLKTENKTVKRKQFISWADLATNAISVKPFTISQQNAINHYRSKYNLANELYFIVLATMPDSNELTQYTIRGVAAQNVIKAYNKHRYVDPKNPVELNENTEDSHYCNFEFLNAFIHSYLEGRTLEIPHLHAPNIQIRIKVDRVYLFSVPSTMTKPLYTSRRGKRSKNRGKKK